jgi:hypothetical protein
MKSVKNLFFSGLALLAIAFASCGDGAGGPPPPPTTVEELLNSLPSLDVSKSTGQPGITITNAPLQGEGAAAINFPSENVNGNVFSVSGGKLNLTLTTPPVYGEGEQKFDDVKRYLFGSEDSANWGTFDPDTVKFCIPSFYSVQGSGSEEKRYYIERSMWETDEKTYNVGVQIVYVYVDNDCTVTRNAKTWEESFDGTRWTLTYSAINLPLKKGWNLVQINGQMTRESADSDVGTGTYTVKIADKDVPWVIYVETRTANAPIPEDAE